MKKILILIMALSMVFAGFTGCGKKDEAQQPEDNPQVEDTTGEQVEQEQPEGEQEQVDEEQNTEEDKTEDESKEPVKEETTKPETSKPSTSTSKPSTSTSKPQTNTETSKPSTSTDDKGKAPSGSTSDVIDKVYEKKPVDLPLATTDVDISDKDSLKAITGITTSADYVKEASYSESMIGSQPYSMVVVRVTDKKNTETVANEMFNGIDKRKWICVEADDLRVAACGDLVFLIMIGSDMSDVATSKDMISGFKSVCGGSVDLTLK